MCCKIFTTSELEEKVGGNNLYDDVGDEILSDSEYEILGNVTLKGTVVAEKAFWQKMIRFGKKQT